MKIFSILFATILFYSPFLSAAVTERHSLRVNLTREEAQTLNWRLREISSSSATSIGINNFISLGGLENDGKIHIIVANFQDDLEKSIELKSKFDFSFSYNQAKKISDKLERVLYGPDLETRSSEFIFSHQNGQIYTLELLLQ